MTLIGQVFRSNGGKGHEFARIIRIQKDTALLTRWHEGKAPIEEFSLPAWFLLSRACGWRLTGWK